MGIDTQRKERLSVPVSYLLHAFFFFTRIPVGNFIVIDEKKLIVSRVLVPLVGLVLGLFQAASFIFLHPLLGKDLAIVLSLLLGVVLTGAFHEDALADCCDGFGAGGHSKKNILTIMKDSRIGTYGTVALIFAFALSYFPLQNLSIRTIPLIIIVTHVVCRFSALPLMLRLAYVAHHSFFEKATKTYTKNLTIFGVIAAGIFTTAVSVFFLQEQGIFFVLIALVVGYITGKYYKKRLGGATGDCFGATIKISEISCYLLAVFLYHL